MVDLIARHLPHNTPDFFVEPMMGGGSVYLGLRSRGFLRRTYAFLGDANRELVALYGAIRKSPRDVYAGACEYAGELRACDDRKGYYNMVRETYNMDVQAGELPPPGLTLFLRWACYNGVFRISRAGNMNMPPRDKLHQVPMPQLSQLESFSVAIKRDVELLNWDFRRYEDDEDIFIGAGTVVYLDPPYDGPKTFKEYTAAGFTQDDQVDLISLAKTWASRGARVIYSNAATDNILDLLGSHWPQAELIIHDQKEIVACKSDARTPRTEVLAWQ